eukprot:GEMP01000438.1.p1 GENE.GEMP01000438.1~~GEMP01000438.1.p1  ORF type:complete len:1489 (+),score=432.99 GEMP01000438.1:122-4588(+)
METYGTLSHQVLGEFSSALATQQLQVSRQPSHTPPDLCNARFSPPSLIRAILLLQSTFRRRKFRRDFGEIDGLEPCSPQIELALYLCRRMRNPGWVNLAKESIGLAGVLYLKKRLSLTCIYKIYMQYLSALGPKDQGVQILKEKMHLVVVQIQEELEAEVEAVPKLHDWGMKVHPIISRTRAEWCVPPALDDSTLGAMVDTLDKYFSATLDELKERLMKNSTTPQIAELHKESHDRLLGVYMTDFDATVQKARRQRREFLIYELETRWEYPLDGNLGPYLAASEQYSVELPADCPQRKSFNNHVKRLKKRLEQESKEAFDAAKEKMRGLRRARDNAPQVKTVLKEFDVMLDDALIAAQNLVAEWSDKLSVSHPTITSNAQSLLTPRSYQNLFLNAGERCAAQLRDPSSPMGVVCEARSCLNSVISILGDAGNTWAEEFPDLRLTVHKEKDPDEEDAPSSPASSNGMPVGFETIEGRPLDHDQGGLHAQTFPIDRDVPEPNYAATLQLLRAFEVPEAASSPPVTTIVIDGDETLRNLSSSEEPETDVGAGTAIVIKKHRFEEPRPGMESGERVLAQLTLFDLSMDDVHQYSEEVLAQKFTKAIAEAGGIDPSRLRVLGFRPGSVKIFLEIDSSVVLDLLREVQSQLQVSNSRLRRSDVGHLCNDAAFESIPRSAFKLGPPKLMSSLDKTAPLVNANSIFYRVDMFGAPQIVDEQPVVGRQIAAADDDGSRVIYRTTFEPNSKKENPYGHHPSYIFYDKPAMQLNDRKWTPYAKFLVTRYPVRAPVNYHGYQSWCDLGKTANEWIPEGTNQVARKYESRLQPTEVKPSDEEPEEAEEKGPTKPIVGSDFEEEEGPTMPVVESDFEEEETLIWPADIEEDGAAVTKKMKEAFPVGGIGMDEEVDVETVRLGPQPGWTDISMEETSRLYPPKEQIEPSADGSAIAAIKIQARYRGRLGRKQWQAARLGALRTPTSAAAEAEVAPAPSAAEEAVTVTAVTDVPVSVTTPAEVGPEAAEEVPVAAEKVPPEAADEVASEVTEKIAPAAAKEVPKREDEISPAVEKEADISKGAPDDGISVLATADDLAVGVKEGEAHGLSVAEPAVEIAAPPVDSAGLTIEMALEMEEEMAAEVAAEMAAERVAEAGGSVPLVKEEEIPAVVVVEEGAETGKQQRRLVTTEADLAVGEPFSEGPKSEDGGRAKTKKGAKAKKASEVGGKKSGAEKKTAEEKPKGEDKKGKKDAAKEEKRTTKSSAKKTPARGASPDAEKGEPEPLGEEDVKADVEMVAEGEEVADDVKAGKEAAADSAEAEKGDAAVEGAKAEKGEAEAESEEADKMKTVAEGVEAEETEAAVGGEAATDGADGAEAEKDVDAEDADAEDEAAADDSEGASSCDADAAEKEAAEAAAAERAATEAAREAEKEARVITRAEAKAKLAVETHATEVSVAKTKKEKELTHPVAPMLSSPKSPKTIKSPQKPRPKSPERPQGHRRRRA